jgi:hypothetical protein
MPLPDLIEIVPPPSPAFVSITVPGSKSITNRALILAALSSGTVTLTGEAGKTLFEPLALSPVPPLLSGAKLSSKGFGLPVGPIKRATVPVGPGAKTLVLGTK